MFKGIILLIIIGGDTWATLYGLGSDKTLEAAVVVIAFAGDVRLYST